MTTDSKQYYAAHAPAVPDWFPFPEFMPKTEAVDINDLNEVHKKEVLSWMRDPCYDLPEELRWFQEKYNARRDERYNFDYNIKHEQRFWNWRKYYAEKMSSLI